MDGRQCFEALPNAQEEEFKSWHMVHDDLPETVDFVGFNKDGWSAVGPHLPTQSIKGVKRNFDLFRDVTEEVVKSTKAKVEAKGKWKTRAHEAASARKNFEDFINERAGAAEVAARAADESARAADERAGAAEVAARAADERAGAADKRAGAAEVAARAADERAGAAEVVARAANERARAADKRAGAAEVAARAADERAGAAEVVARAANERAGSAEVTARAADERARAAEVTARAQKQVCDLALADWKAQAEDTLVRVATLENASNNA